MRWISINKGWLFFYENCVHIKYKSPCGAEGEEKARYPQGLNVLFYTILFLLSSQPEKLRPMTPHSVDDVTGAFGSSVCELSFLHPEQKSPTAIRQINSNLTCFILYSFHKLGFPIYADLSRHFILCSRQLEKAMPIAPRMTAETHSQSSITTTETIIANTRTDCRLIMQPPVSVFGTSRS